MGSLITALQNQNIADTRGRIADANQETLGDIYAANPQNLGYTENPFGYTSSPAVVQTAYPQYGYNATSPMVQPSYEDYDLTSLFGMLEDVRPGKPSLGDFDVEFPPYHDPRVALPPPDIDSDQRFFALEPRMLGQAFDIDGQPVGRTGPFPTTPAGILAEVSKRAQPSGTPVPGAYTVPGAVTAPTAPSKEEQEAAQAAEDKRIRDMIAEDAKKRQRAALEQQYQRTFAGIVSGPPGYTTKNLSNAEMIRLIENPELITGDE